jgi:imidazolonepropionase-like amidohydrolase
VKVPAQAQVVDGTGKFLIPGMWDMHIHIHRWDEFPLLLVTA